LTVYSSLFLVRKSVSVAGGIAVEWEPSMTVATIAMYSIRISIASSVSWEEGTSKVKGHHEFFLAILAYAMFHIIEL